MKTYIITAINDITNEIKQIAIVSSLGFDNAAKTGINSLNSMGYKDFIPLEVKIASDNTPIGILT